MSTPDSNLSTEHQRPGDAKRPSDTLDRDQDGADPGRGSPVEGARSLDDNGAKAGS